MPTASKSGTRKATCQNWRGVDRPRSRLGPRSRPRPHPFTELASALETLIRFHQTHPDWFPPPSCGGGLPPSPPALSPEWEEAIRKAYYPDPIDPASGRDGRAAPSISNRVKT
ncbi:MAG: hypothetical protein WCJ07_13915 [Verrucomicrobiota bacterium]